MKHDKVSLENLKQWYKEHEKKIHDDYFTFLRFKSISTDPAYAGELRKTANWVASFLKESGLEVEIWETPGHPVVFGTYLKAGENRPTLLLYVHYDVQPVDPVELWKSPPFEPTVINNIVYARGACDNKGQCFYTMQAIRAFLELSKKANLNIKLFVEGEEESGSRGTKEVLAAKKNELKADYLLVVDMDIPAEGTPAITLGSRGLVTMEVECINSKIDLHSGAHGGIALNPNRILATLLAEMWDEKGKVAVPGFYDGVLTVSKEEKERFFLDFDPSGYRSSFGVGAFAEEPGFSPTESNVLRPTLEINGMWGGYTGAGFKTVIPAKAHAKISARLVPNQDPQKIGLAIADFLRSKCPPGAKLNIVQGDGEKAFRGSSESVIAKIAEKSYQEVFGKPCRLRLSGGSIPITPSLVAATGAEATMMGMGLDTDDIHAPNEHFGLDRLELGFLVVGKILESISETK